MLRIIIEGPVAVGKTTAGNTIEEALTAAGFNVVQRDKEGERALDPTKHVTMAVHIIERQRQYQQGAA